jgi:hypothetical protein
MVVAAHADAAGMDVGAKEQDFGFARNVSSIVGGGKNPEQKIRRTIWD